MKFYSFKNDYSEGAHPNILQALVESNSSQQAGYGQDNYSLEAISILRKKIENQNVDIHFVSGGTQTNLIIISSMLKPYEAVIAAPCAHISVHEAGAIEATGHKILTTNANNDKVTPEDIESILNTHTDEHMVKPKLVFISNSTEKGNIYKKSELVELSAFCKKHSLFLYVDGARLGSALCSQENDLDLALLSKYTDAFYIGGTKNGALFGEAIVINNEDLKRNFRFFLKQKGALLAKGRILGVQFIELFKNDLYFKLATHANLMAHKLGNGIVELGYELLNKPVTNQIFAVIPNNIIEKMNLKYDFYLWSHISDDISAIRLVTSWATYDEAVDSFLSDLKNYSV